MWKSAQYPKGTFHASRLSLPQGFQGMFRPKSGHVRGKRVVRPTPFTKLDLGWQRLVGTHLREEIRRRRRRSWRRGSLGLRFILPLLLLPLLLGHLLLLVLTFPLSLGLPAAAAAAAAAACGIGEP